MASEDEGIKKFVQTRQSLQLEAPARASEDGEDDDQPDEEDAGLDVQWYELPPGLLKWMDDALGPDEVNRLLSPPAAPAAPTPLPPPVDSE